MLYIMLSFSAICICAFVILIFGLLKAGRRADEGEERILDIIMKSNQTSQDIEEDKLEQNHKSKTLAYK